MTNNNVYGVFNPPPERWGLRGDPLLWKELENMTLTLPKTAADFKAFLVTNIEEILGQKLTDNANPYIKRFDIGGMSSGQVSGKFWVKTGLPLLQQRYNKSVINLSLPKKI